ncbi:MAG: TerD family protein [Oscillospiraceae bacterium]|nr:TerD family protein [Oscillospiraceae bacterium]
MDDNLKQIIDRARPNTEIQLPSGEFEGPVVITKPIKIIGSTTTIWAKKSPALVIRSAGVKLENLRAELTEANSEDAVICADFPCEVKNVEVLGGVSGFGAEDGFFDVPKTIRLGEFLPEEESSFKLTVNVPDKTEIQCDMRNVRFEPNLLKRGRNDIIVKVSGISLQTYLYTEVLFKTRFTRRIYLFGKPSVTAQRAENKPVYEAPERDFSAAINAGVLPKSEAGSKSDVVSMSDNADLSLGALSLTRGMRVPLTKYLGTKFTIFFSCKEMPKEMDIDPYVFLLDENGKALADSSLIFFGNERSENGEAAYFPKDGHVEIDLAKIDYRIKKITFAYSIYAGGEKMNFSMVRNPRISLWTDRERVSFVMNELNDVTTAVALEFYIYKGEWKISAVGAGYRDGMARLCESCGIQVEE